jgi:hypothetical protein
VCCWPEARMRELHGSAHSWTDTIAQTKQSSIGGLAPEILKMQGIVSKKG